MRFTRFARVAFVLTAVTLVLGLGPTPAGLVAASAQPFRPDQCVRVSGAVEYVQWVQSTDYYFDRNGNFVNPGHVLIWKLHGDLEGVYVITVTYVMPLPPPYTVDYTFYGYATFIGTLKGKQTNWVANVEGAGHFSNFAAFAGHEAWRSEIFRSTGPLPHLSGDFGISGDFDFSGATTGEPYTYSGKIRFDDDRNR